MRTVNEASRTLLGYARGRDRAKLVVVCRNVAEAYRMPAPQQQAHAWAHGGPAADISDSTGFVGEWAGHLFGQS